MARRRRVPSVTQAATEARQRKRLEAEVDRLHGEVARLTQERDAALTLASDMRLALRFAEQRAHEVTLKLQAIDVETAQA